MPLIKDLSVTKWEVSEFGGYKKLLYDYPEIKLDWDIDYEVPTGMDKVKDLGMYSSGKLVKLFLLKAKDNRLLDFLVSGAKKVVVKTLWSEKQMLVCDPKAISVIVNSLIASEAELKNLFFTYKDVLVKTEIMYDIPDPKDKKSSSGKEEGEGNGENQDDSEGQGEGSNKEISLKDLQSMMRAALQTTKERGTPSGLYLGNDYLGGSLSKQAEFIYPNKTKKEANLSGPDLTYANHLVNMLDISFDPQVDKIHNVRTGKIDPNKIAEVVPGSTHVYYRVEENQTTKPFSICILGDESGSMAGPNISNQKRLIKILFTTFSQILPPDKIFVYGHSDGYGNRAGSWDSNPGIFVYHDKYNHTFSETISTMTARGSNYDGPVIEAVYRKVREYTQDNIIFISISDGQPCGANYGGAAAIKDMKKIIEKCKRDGFVTIGIGFRYGGVKDIYNYHTIITDFSEMVKKVSGVVNEVVKTEFQS